MTVEVAIFGRNMDITDRIDDYVTKKVSRLDRFLSGIEEARVDLSYAKSARSASDRQVAQITLRGKGFILRSEERADDIFAALDIAIDKIQRQIERYKGKRNRGRGDGKSLAEAALEEMEVEEIEFDEPIPAFFNQSATIGGSALSGLASIDLFIKTPCWETFRITADKIRQAPELETAKTPMSQPDPSMKQSSILYSLQMLCAWIP